MWFLLKSLVFDQEKISLELTTPHLYSLTTSFVISEFITNSADCIALYDCEQIFGIENFAEEDRTK